jgi:hypothetical protein
VRQKLNDGHRMGGGLGRASWARAQSETEGEGARLRAQLSGGGRVSVCGLQKRLGRVGAWQGNAQSWARPRRRARAVRGETVPTGGAHGTKRVGERMVSRADERGPWDSERRSACAKETGTGQREGEKGAHGRGLAPTGGDHLSEGGERARGA